AEVFDAARWVHPTERLREVIFGPRAEHQDCLVSMWTKARSEATGTEHHRVGLDCLRNVLAAGKALVERLRIAPELGPFARIEVLEAAIQLFSPLQKLVEVEIRDVGMLGQSVDCLRAHGDALMQVGDLQNTVHLGTPFLSPRLAKAPML